MPGWERHQLFEGGSSNFLSENELEFVKPEINKFSLQREARLRVALEDSVNVNPAYKTLFLGLKQNHEHNMAVVHPITYVLRRILYAVVIVFMQGENLTFFGAVSMQITCIIMLCIVAMEKQFSERLINWQHFFNESVFYMVCLGLILLSGVVIASGLLANLSFAGMVLTCIFLAVNIIVILIQTICFMRFVLLRFFA